MKNCPEFGGGLISQVHFHVLDRARDSLAALNSQFGPISKVVLKTDFTVLIPSHVVENARYTQ